MRRKERERFYHEKRPHPLRNLCLSLILFICICGVFFGSFGRFSATTRRKQKESLENALWHGVTQYYALEGRYPETLSDLTESCGIQYDENQFFIDYQIAGSNILPDITVIER